MGQFLVQCSTTGVNEIQNSTSNILVYPNPANDLLTIQLNSITENFTTEIFNTLGEKIYQSANNKTIDVSTFSQGMYFISVHQGNKILTAKFIKQ